MEKPDSIGTTKIIKVDFSNDQSFTIELENQMNLKIGIELLLEQI